MTQRRSESVPRTDAGAGRWLPVPIYLLAAATFVVGTDKDLLVGILPQMTEALDTRPELVVQLATVFAVTYAVAAPVLAVTLAHVPRRRLMVAALLLFSGANLVCAVAPGYAVLLIGRVLAALGAAAFTPCAAAAGADAAGPARAGRALAVVFAGFSLASIVGVPFGSLVGEHAGWRWIFVVIAALGLVVAVGLYRFLGPLTTPPVASLSSRLSLLADARVRRVLAVSATAQAAGFAFLLLISVYAAHVTGSTSLTTVLVLCFGLFGFAGTWLAGRFSDRRDPVVVMRWAVGVAAVALALMPVLARDAVALTALVAIWALAQWAITVPVQATLIRVRPDAGSIAVSLNSSAMYLGSAAAGLIGAGALDRAGIAHVPTVAAVVLAMAWLTAMSIRPLGGRVRA